MKLPIRDLPLYSVYLEASDITVKYRPHTVKEEQILNMASLSDSESEKLEAVFQICENCIDYDIYKLYPAEIEYMFMKIKACSDTPKVPVIYTVDPEIDEHGKNIHENCPDEISSTFDINKDVEVIIDKTMNDYGKRNKDGTWIIDLENDIKIQIRVKPLITVTNDSIYDLIESIIDEKEDTVLYKDTDFNREEIVEWVEKLPSSTFKNFNKFMDRSPTCVAHLSFKCKCGKVFEEKEYGVVRFLV